jgi:N-acetylglucosaminyldiphosphoundecaprenol N-acetyl-beta-D-mannosaminyltransferase
MSTSQFSLKTTQLFGWQILAGTKADWWSRLVSQLEKPTTNLINLFTPNPEIVMLAQANPTFHQTISQADYLIPDGVGLIWASHQLTPLTPIQERIAGTDVVADLLELAATKNWPVLVIGGRGYDTNLTSLPGKVSWVKGFEDVHHPTELESEQILSELQRLKPRLVFVALGAPFQETWIMSHQPVLASAGVKLAMSVGGAFDFLLGKVLRAPGWIQNLGLEWLFRLVLQPWRIGRQLALVKFWWLVQFGRPKTV